MKQITLVMLLTLAGSSVSAAAMAEPPLRNDPQVQAMFEKRRSIEAVSHKERIRILQEADTCINAAQDYRSFRDCEHQEQHAREDLRQQLKPEVEALRREWQAFRTAHSRE